MCKQKIMIIIKLAYRWFAEVSGDRICLVERQLEVWMRGAWEL